MFVATYEHVIHVESFKNIDLFQQGLYYLKFYLSHNGQIAQPYNYFEGNSKKQQQWANQNEDANAFQTKTFMIRFQEEEVEIDESCIFKIEVNATPQYECEFTIICELMCADIQKIGGPPSEELFKSASVFEAKIKNSHRGVHEYVPVMFDNHHFCVVNCTMHSILQDFKFRLSDLQVSLNQDNQQKRLKVSVQPKTFTEFLHRSTQRFTQTQQFFDYYVVQLKESCENLLQLVAKLCGSLKLNQELQKLPTIPKYSFIQYQESSVFNDKKNNQNLKIADVLNLQNIKDQHLLATLIENDINQYSSVLFELQNQLVQIIQKNSKQYRTILQKDYKMKLKDKLGETCFREIIKTDNFSIGTNCQKQHNEISGSIRKKPQLIESLIDVQDQILFQDNKCSTILFEEIYQRLPPVAASNQYHVLFLVHGFQGNSLDMRLIRNHIQLMHPNIHFYSSKSNEDQTDGDIGNMGFNLAQEVKQHIIESVKGQNYKISFLGHSLGGVIIRAALPHLQDLKLSMHSFISLSSPHLGYAYNNSALIDAGLWFLKQMRKSISLTQLAMSDSEQIENTFLFKLSKQQGLNWFQNILLVCSSQDQYVPFESARIQKCFECNDQNYKKYEKMVENLMQGLRANQIKRLNVNFQLQENRTLDNMIGRSAHIMFLENPQFLKMLSTCIEDIFN